MSHARLPAGYTPLQEMQLVFTENWLRGTFSVNNETYTVSTYFGKEDAEYYADGSNVPFEESPGTFGSAIHVYVTAPQPSGKLTSYSARLWLPITKEEAGRVLNNMGSSCIKFEMRSWMRDGQCYTEILDSGVRTKYRNLRAGAECAEMFNVQSTLRRLEQIYADTRESKQ